ncbi:MAG: hypothetical protein HY043_04230 [Verrucomicrobia bacterium]|nr:hypothetical protein [Verrucomicrobiota bacterium]
MSATEATESTEYTGRCCHGVDQSRRVMIPSEWRPTEADVKFTLIPWPIGSEDRILVLPPARWKEMRSRLAAESMSDPEVAALETQIAANSAKVALDKVGRMCLPETLSKTVGLKKEVELVGRIDKFEIWNPAGYAKADVESREMAISAFKRLRL